VNDILATDWFPAIHLLSVHQYKPDVVVANWGLLHHMWHESVEEWEDFLEDLGKELDGMKERGEHQPRYTSSAEIFDHDNTGTFFRWSLRLSFLARRVRVCPT